MKIGLYNLEPQIFNSAMMQVSRYHKDQGDEVYEYSPLFHDQYDKVYAFSLFDFTDKGYVRDDMICGGTGFDVKSRLPPEIEAADLDYSIFPECDYSIIWFSRGCFRNCPFCIVREKEGNIHPVQPKNLNPTGEYIKVMDNNFFANPEWRSAIQTLQEWNQPVDIQGFDIRIFDRVQGEALKSLKHHKSIKFAWDNPRENIDEYIENVLNYFRPRDLLCYVLIGYWSNESEDLMRVNHLIDNYGIRSYIMPYDNSDWYQRNFARWVNNRSLCTTRTWQQYKQGYNQTYARFLKRKVKQIPQDQVKLK